METKLFSKISKVGESVEKGIVLAEVLQLAKVDVPNSGSGLGLAVFIFRLAFGRFALWLLRLDCVWSCFVGQDEDLSERFGGLQVL